MFVLFGEQLLFLYPGKGRIRKQVTGYSVGGRGYLGDRVRSTCMNVTRSALPLDIEHGLSVWLTEKSHCNSC